MKNTIELTPFQKEIIECPVEENVPVFVLSGAGCGVTTALLLKADGCGHNYVSRHKDEISLHCDKLGLNLSYSPKLNSWQGLTMPDDVILFDDYWSVESWDDLPPYTMVYMTPHTFLEKVAPTITGTFKVVTCDFDSSHLANVTTEMFDHYKCCKKAGTYGEWR